jgi:hypothetical protein
MMVVNRSLILLLFQPPVLPVPVLLLSLWPMKLTKTSRLRRKIYFSGIGVSVISASIIISSV